MQTAHLIYFSPTGTTRKVCEAIAQGLGANKVIHYDVTLPDSKFDTVLNRWRGDYRHPGLCRPHTGTLSATPASNHGKADTCRARCPLW